MPLICHIIQRCCKLTINVRVVPEICTGITKKYTTSVLLKWSDVFNVFTLIVFVKFDRKNKWNYWYFGIVICFVIAKCYVWWGLTNAKRNICSVWRDVLFGCYTGNGNPPGCELFLIIPSHLFFVSGYGHVAPKTSWGRLVTIIYALVGIPLTFLYLSNIGNFLADCFRLFYKKVRLFIFNKCELSLLCTHDLPGNKCKLELIRCGDRLQFISIHSLEVVPIRIIWLIWQAA